VFRDGENGTVLEAAGVAIAVAVIVALATKWHSEMNERFDVRGRIETPSSVSRKPEISSLNAFTE
jgi:hypothetical protein